ncbi:MAG: hypothetical protein FWF04_04445 [Clostridiales bacterium]|nr:hypothetical protein [Clostridiales bacterium]
MLIVPEWFLSLRCPCCQERLIYRALSRFELAKGKKLNIRCSCGGEPLHLRFAGKHLYADCYCPCCEDAHSYIFRLRDMKVEPPFMLGCDNMDIRLACIGGRESVCEAMNEESALILDYADELGDYFVKPLIIGRSLLRLNRLLSSHACQCANCGREDMDILILADRLVLTCPHCGRNACIYAARTADLHLLNKISRISLQEGGTRIRY